jgi:hypothetical protein
MTLGMVGTEAIDAANRSPGPCLTSTSPMPATAPPSPDLDCQHLYRITYQPADEPRERDNSRLLGDESVTQGGGDRSTSVAHAEPAVDVVEVRFDGGGADADLLGDLSRREAVGGQAEHLGLP